MAHPQDENETVEAPRPFPLWACVVLGGATAVVALVSGSKLSIAIEGGIQLGSMIWVASLLERYSAHAYPAYRSTWRSWLMATVAACGLFGAAAGVTWLILKLMGALD